MDKHSEEMLGVITGLNIWMFVSPKAADAGIQIENTRNAGLGSISGEILRYRLNASGQWP